MSKTEYMEYKCNNKRKIDSKNKESGERTP